MSEIDDKVKIKTKLEKYKLEIEKQLLKKHNNFRIKFVMFDKINALLIKGILSGFNLQFSDIESQNQFEQSFSKDTEQYYYFSTTLEYDIPKFKVVVSETNDKNDLDLFNKIPATFIQM